MGARPLAYAVSLRIVAGVRAFRLACAIGAGLAAMPAAAEEVAVLQGLDKVTARISTVRAPVGLTVRFGSLEIIARTCVKRPPEEPPESAAFLEISDVKQGETPVKVFSGWMFASSPALSALEHPVYDISVVDCTNSSSSDSAISR
jgi:hypothetical protein